MRLLLNRKILAGGLLVLAAVFVFVSVSGQEAPAEPQGIKIELTSGEYFTGVLKGVDEGGLRLKVNEDQTLFIEWKYTRGDFYYDLRRRATDFRNVESLLNLADFCHMFALDAEQLDVLRRAQKIDPDNIKVRERLKRLPAVVSVEVPETRPDPKPVVKGPDKPGEPKEPTPEPEPEPEPAPVKNPTLLLDIDDKGDLAWFQDELERLEYKFGKKKWDHDIRVEVLVTLTLVRNPTWFGAELYAVYDGKAEIRLYEPKEKKPFAEDEVAITNIRKNNRAQASKACRRSVRTVALSKVNDLIKARR